METSFENILVEGPDFDGVMSVTLNRPDRLNAATPQMAKELMAVAMDLRSSHDVGAVVLTGAGMGFCAGADMSEIHEFADESFRTRVMDQGVHLVHDFLRIRPPLVVAVNGPAVGFGAMLALTGDIVFMAENAIISDPHVRNGIVAGDGGALLWPALIGPSRAKEFLLTGDRMDAQTALQYGLVNRVYPAERLVQEANAFARRLAAGSRHAIAWTKQVINISLLREADWVLPLGNAQEARTQAMPDMVEGIAAFLDKRQPSFPSGRPNANGSTT
jgi:enoyl-CoA hydratase